MALAVDSARDGAKTILKRIFTTALARIAGGFVDGANADEAYLCEGGRVVHIEPGQLELLRSSDACIAGCFGLKPKPGSASAEAAPAPSAVRPAERPSPGAVRIINAGESGRRFKPAR